MGGLLGGTHPALSRAPWAGRPRPAAGSGGQGPPSGPRSTLGVPAPLGAAGCTDLSQAGAHLVDFVSPSCWPVLTAPGKAR